jgi:hypothetical protein
MYYNPTNSIPNAVLRLVPGSKCEVRIRMPAGVLAAAPDPCRAMKRIKVTSLGAKAAII